MVMIYGPIFTSGRPLSAYLSAYLSYDALADERAHYSFTLPYSLSGGIDTTLPSALIGSGTDRPSRRK